MNKDPAFLFYPESYLGGTMGYTYELHGAYLLALIYQFQKGRFCEEQILPVVGDHWKTIKSNFTQDGDNRWYNQRLEFEQKKREEYSKSRSENQKKRWKKENICNDDELHMRNRNRNKEEGGAGGENTPRGENVRLYNAIFKMIFASRKNGAFDNSLEQLNTIWTSENDDEEMKAKLTEFKSCVEHSLN